MLPLLTAMNGLSASSALQVNCLGDEFFSRAALALNQHRAAAWRDLGHKIEDLKDLVALSNNVAVAVTLSKRAAQMRVLTHKATLLDARCRQSQEACRCPRAW